MADPTTLELEMIELDRMISEATGELAASSIPWSIDEGSANQLRGLVSLHRASVSNEFLDQNFQEMLAAHPDFATGDRRIRVPRQMVRATPSTTPLPGTGVTRPPRQASRFVRMRSSFASASLVMIILIGMGGSWYVSSRPASSVDEISNQIVVTSSSALIGAGADAVIEFDVVTLDSGDSISMSREGPTLFAVESGAVVLRVANLTSNSTARAGEGMEVPAFQGFSLTNEGSEPSTVLIVGTNPFYAAAGFATTSSRAMRRQIGAPKLEVAGEAKLSLRLITVPAGGKSGVGAPNGPTWVLRLSGVLGMTLTGSSTNDDLVPGVKKKTTTPFPFPIDAEAIAKNEGSTALVLALFTITPQDPATPDPG